MCSLFIGALVTAPSSGKTVNINTLREAYEALGMHVVVVAPTGTSAVALRGMTVHRYLRAAPAYDENGAEKVCVCFFSRMHEYASLCG